MTTKAFDEQFDMYGDGEKGDFLDGQPQYDKYVKCSKVRIQLCTFGTTTTKSCGSAGGGNNQGGDGGGCGGGGGANNGCSGPGDSGEDGYPTCFSFAEFMTDRAPCPDAGDLSPYKYCYDVMNGNGFFDLGLITEPVPC